MTVMSDDNITGKYPLQPDYQVETDQDPVLAGMTYKIDPDILGNRFNTIDIDVNSQEVVDELAEEYPLAWEVMYKDGTSYSYTAQNAYKLVRAVEYYKWLHPEEFGTSNVFKSENTGELDYTIEEANTHRVQVPFGEFMTSTKWSEFRVPLDLQYSRDFTNDVSAISPVPHYYDERGYAVEVVDVIVTTSSTSGLSKSYVYKDQNGNDVSLFMHYEDQNGNVVPVTVPIFAPYLLESARSIRARYHRALMNKGDNAFDVDEGTWMGFSKEFLDLKSHQVGHKATPSPYDWGGEFAAGKNGFPN